MTNKIDADNQRAIFSKNLNRYMERFGKTIADISSDLSFPFSTVSDWVHGRKYPRMDKVQIIADYFGVLKSNLTEEDQHQLPSNVIPMPKTYKVPLVGTIACGQPILAVEEAEELVDVPEDIRADFALLCKGDSMVDARIFDGDIVYIRKQPEVDNGQIAAVLIGDEATLKKVRTYPDMVILEPANPAYEPLVYRKEEMNDITILGRAVAFTSLVR